MKIITPSIALAIALFFVSASALMYYILGGARQIKADFKGENIITKIGDVVVLAIATTLATFGTIIALLALVARFIPFT